MFENLQYLVSGVAICAIVMMAEKILEESF